ncbi:Spy/CpxP family protein refolding chaperone [Alteromonas sp. H39]|uniref:Spy/CpxP family protein refolding chaperone n=1 Tax=Alteromonas sp. H39 TaxID=3389876 RepID=UPI0039E18DB4
MKKPIIAIIAGVLAVSGVATAGPIKGPGSGMMDVLRELDLTREQKQDIRNLMQEHREDAILSDIPAPEISQFGTDTANLDEAELKETLTARAAALKAEHFERAALRHDIYQLLTTTQRNTLEQQDISRQERFAKRRGRTADNRLPRSFSALSLTDAQETELLSLQKSFSTESEQKRALLKTFIEKEKALIRSDNFSESAWHALAESYQQDFINAMVAHAKHKASMMAVLDEEQKQTLIAMREERQQHHHKPHRR